MRPPARSLVAAALVLLALSAPARARAEVPPVFLLEFGTGCS